jgi:hypothetical protein
MNGRPPWWADDLGLRRGYVVPHSGEIVDVPVIPDAPPIPVPGPPLTIPRLGDRYTWGDVWTATSNAWHTVTSIFHHAASVTMDDVLNVTENALSLAQTYWSSFITHLATELTAEITDLSAFAINLDADIRKQIVGLYGDIVNVGNFAVALDYALYDELAANIRNIEHLLALTPGVIIGDVEAWAIDRIYNPLLNDITTSVDNVEAVVAEAVHGIDAELSHLNDVVVPGLLATLGLLLTQVGTITTWVDDCGAPMCESFGPNTDLGKLLKGLEALLGILAGVGLANMTEADVEHVARFFKAIKTGTVDDFVNAFARRGATLGSAGGTIISDLETIAAETVGVVTGL